MEIFNESTATSEELYNYCVKEYYSRNIISRILIDRFYYKLEKDIIEPVISEINNVIEIGCGAAESTLRIKKAFGDIEYQATEYDKRYIDAINKRNLPFNVTQENVYSLTKSDNSFDCVIMLEVLEHLEDYELALKEIFRVSSKYVIISIPAEPLWRILNLLRFKYILNLGNTPGHINHWGKKSISKLLSHYGKIRKIILTMPWIIVIVEKYDNKIQ